MPGVIPRLRWEVQADGSIDLVMPRDLEALNGERPAGRLAQLARVTSRTLRLVIDD